MTGPAAPVPADATMSVARANALALLWLPLAVALILGPFVLIWGTRTLGAGVVRLLPLAVLVPGLAGGIVVHELLHAVGFLAFGRVPRQDVRVGVCRRTLTPYATCRAPVTAAAYRATALLPAIGLGVVPGAVSVVTGAGWLAAWAALMLALAGGDLAAVWAIRHLPPGTPVLDHPTRVGCTVVRS